MQDTPLNLATSTNTLFQTEKPRKSNAVFKYTSQDKSSLLVPTKDQRTHLLFGDLTEAAIKAKDTQFFRGLLRYIISL